MLIEDNEPTLTSKMTTLSYAEARTLLTESGRGANEAQDILDDLAHWGPRKSFSVKTADGLKWMRYGGLRPQTLQPVYKLEENQ